MFFSIKSIKNILPGWSLHLFLTDEGLIGNTPISEERRTVPSSVTRYLDGRKPFLSRIAPIFFPSVKHIAAGPSQGSIKLEK